jgi:hypothetical protein
VPPNRTIRAADVKSLPVAQQIVDTVREAYLAQPGAMLISGVTLNPLEVLAVHASTGQSFRVPVMTKADGAPNFGAPIRNVPGGAPSLPVAAASQALSGRPSDRDRRRIQAAVDRGAILPSRVAWWSARAAAGEDISGIDQLVGGLLPVEGKVTAAAAQEDQDYPDYRALYGTVQAGQQVADAREAAARNAAPETGEEAYDLLFRKVSAAAAPIAASAARPVEQHGRGETGSRRYRVHAPLVSLRVPRSPDGLAASADPAKTAWRTIDLHGGDLVPQDAHPDDIARLRHQKNRLGPLIKPW